MPSTEVSLCNRALALVSAEKISALDDGTVEAEACRLHVRPAIEETLEAAPWGCARARAQLALNATPPAFGWDYSYALPADYLRLLSLNNISAYDNEAPRRIIEGKNLLTNETTAHIEYIRTPYADANFALNDLTAGCTRAIVQLLAHYLVIEIRQDDNRASRLYQLWRNEIATAPFLNSGANMPRPYNERSKSQWLGTRRS